MYPNKLNTKLTLTVLYNHIYHTHTHTPNLNAHIIHLPVPSIAYKHCHTVIIIERLSMRKQTLPSLYLLFLYNACHITCFAMY